MRYFWIFTLSFAVLFIISTWSLYITDFMYVLGINQHEVSLGDWGDSFGALGFLATAIGTVFVVFTLKLQADVQKTQTDQFSHQKEQDAKQEFERTFFELMRMLSEHRLQLEFKRPSSERIREIERTTKTNEELQPTLPFLAMPVSKAEASRSHSFFFRIPKEETTESASLESDALNRSYRNDANGRDAIKTAYNLLYSQLRNAPPTPGAAQSLLVRTYDLLIHQRSGSSFGPYFRTIYAILQRISFSPLSESEKEQYSKILRGQLTDQEAALLATAALSASSGNLMDFLIKYRMIRYSKEGRLRDLLEKIYPPEAFEPRNLSSLKESSDT